MNQLYRLCRRPPRKGAVVIVVAVLLGSVMLAGHFPDRIEATADTAAPGAASPGGTGKTEPFVYFPSQYELHAPAEPEEHIQAF